MRKLTHGSLFSGIGGFDLAAEWMGWDNKFHCEWNEFGQKVLNHYWPMAESFTDITKTDFTKYYGTVDIITGGFPCQPYSSAGKRKGKEDERHLWPEMLRAIREVSPRFVVGENVRGLTNWNGGLVFEEVCAELESYGYQVAPIIIPACAVNAPHRRERIWFVAYAPSLRNDSEQSGGVRSEDAATDRERTYPIYDGITPEGNQGIITNAKSSRSPISKLGESESKQQVQTRSDIDGFESLGNATDTDSGGLERSEEVGWDSINVERESEFGLAANTNSNGFQKQGESTELEGGRLGFNNTQNNKTTWDNFPTKSPVCGGDDGISSELDGITFPKWRNETIKAYGNAIVPQVAYQIFKAIEKTLYL